MQRDDATLLDIERSCGLIAQFTAHMKREVFRQDLKTQSAVLHQLQIIGEAAKRLSASLRELHPEVPWELMAGMRNRIIHGYDAVDLDEVWRTVE